MPHCKTSRCAADIDADSINGEVYHDDWIRIANAKSGIRKYPRVTPASTLTEIEDSRKRVAEWERTHHAKTCADFDRQLAEAKAEMIRDYEEVNTSEHVQKSDTV